MKSKIETSGDSLPRLQLDAMDPALASYLAPRVARLGYLGEWFMCAAHAPEVLLAFLRFTDALKTALAMNVTEVVVLTMATALRNSYERNQHERLAVRTGYSREWIAEVEALAPDAAAHMADDERAAQRYTLSAVRADHDAVRQHFQALADHFTPGERIAIVLLVGRYWTHGLGIQTLQLAPPVPSIFEDGFAA